MKQAELIKKITDGVSVVTGRIQSYKAEQTAKAGCNEKFGILVGDSVHQFTVWASKGTGLDKIARPAFADKPGTVVAALDAFIKQDGKYLRTGASAVVTIEP